MNKVEQTKYLRFLKSAYRRANALVKKYPHLDRDTIVQVYFCLKRTPEQRLYWAFLRGGKISPQ